MNRRTKRLVMGAMWATLALGLALIAVVVLGSCAAVKPACQVISIADDACEVFEITLPDGSKERVPGSELRKFGVQHRNFRLSIEKVQRGGE